MRVLHLAVALALCVDGVMLWDCGLSAFGVPASGESSEESDDESSVEINLESRRTLPSEAKAAAAAEKRKSGDVERPYAHDIQDVARAWMTVKQLLPLKYIGVTMLTTFLKLYPEYLKFFADTDAERLDRLSQNKKFVAKSLSFIYDLSSMLDNLDDPELVEILAKRFGVTRQKDGATKTFFDDIRNLVLHLLARYHKQYALRFPLGIMESTTRTLNWLFVNMKKDLDPEPS